MKHPINVIVKLACCALLVAFVFTACTDDGAPVQNQDTSQYDGSRTRTVPKIAANFLAKLNPINDTPGGCGDYYSSAGYNVTPDWVSHTYDLSAYANHNVQIIFSFNTGDAQYNKWEGWYLDDIDIDGTVDNVESGAGDWVATGFWHIGTARFVSGSHSWRYANAAGNYQGGNDFSDPCYDQANYGTLTSGVIGLGATPALSFQTLWQIEGVDPPYFDLMEVYINDLGMIPVAIDAKPGGCPNPFNVNGNGTFPVAILGSDVFDVNDIDPTTVRLEGVLQGPQMPYYADESTPYGMLPVDCYDCNAAGPDGYYDMTYYFAVPDLAAAIDPVNDDDCRVVMIMGKLNNGLNFFGRDVLKIIKKK